MKAVAVLMNKQVLLALGTIAFVAAASVAATGAFFSDTETSTGNTFAAGTLALTLEDWDGSSTSTHAPFNVTGMMPGDSGQKEIVVTSSADAWAKVTLTPTFTHLVDDASGDLEDVLEFSIEASKDGTTWIPLDGTSGTPDATDELISASPIVVYTADITDPTTGDGQWMDAGQSYYFRISYDLPTTAGNEAQGDKIEIGAEIVAQQYQNNTDRTQNGNGNGTW